MEKSTVTVVIPAFDATPHLARSIESALEQTRPPEEILVVDDGSTDGSADLADSYGPPVRVVRHDRNRGLATARNTGIRNATGALIALLDADDRWLPEKLERQLALLDASPSNVGVVFCLTRIICPNGSAWVDCADVPPPDSDPHGFLRSLLVKNAVSGSGCSPLIRRDLLLRNGGYNETLRTCEDWDLWLRLASNRTGYRRVDEVLCEGYARAEGLSLKLDWLLADARVVLRRHLPGFIEDPAEAERIERQALELITRYVTSLTEAAAVDRIRGAELRRFDRGLLEAHLDSVVELEAAIRAELGDAYSHEEWTAAHFLAEREEKWKLSVGAFAGERLTAFLFASLIAGEAHIHRVAVRAEARRGGLARALVEHVARQARQKGARRMTLSVAAENQGAITFWTRLGFQPASGATLAALAAKHGLEATDDGVGVGGRTYRIFTRPLSSA